MADLRLEDTIAALATPVGESAIAVIRVSGPDTYSILAKIFTPRKGSLSEFQTQTLHLGEIHGAGSSEVLDQVVIGVFRAPHSYTGEDLAEISCHGSAAVVRRILDLLLRSGTRAAEPGEFTRRAFLNHKIDLVQAEAVLDLIRSKSDQALRVATRQLAGALSEKFQSLKTLMMNLLAHMEAYLDFPDEHLEVYSNKEFHNQYKNIQSEMKALIHSFERSSLLREGMQVVITGKPNVGKSSLFNALLVKERALVSQYAGTTRDVLEESLQIKGIQIRLLDTAGLSPQAGHPLDAMGMSKTRAMLEQADLFLYIVDGSAAFEEADHLVFEEIKAVGKPVVVLINKTDLPSKIEMTKIQTIVGAAPCGRPHSRTRPAQGPAPASILKISAKTGEGIDAVQQHLEKTIEEQFVAREGEQITRVRHKDALAKALEALQRSEEAFLAGKSLEFVTLDLKLALDELRELIGEIYSDDLLDVIFSEFCIGK